MMLRILSGLSGALLGIGCGWAWTLLDGLSSRADLAPASTVTNGSLGLWLLGGMLAGMVLAEPQPVQRSKPFPVYPPLVETQPARCAWCRGQGHRLFFFRCPVCNGQGSVLVVRPKRHCAWCRGTGRRFFFRCPACGGAGWLQHHHHLY